MARLLQTMWAEEEGVLSFEWTLLVVLLVIGIVSGVAAARDAILDELGDTAEAMLAYDQSFTFAGIPALGIPPSSYVDPGHTFVDCGRNQTGPFTPRDDAADGG